MKNKLFLLFLSVIFFLGNFVFAKVLHPSQWNLPWINLITRQQWWADNSWLFADNSWYQQIIRIYEKKQEELKKLKQENFDLRLQKQTEKYYQNKQIQMLNEYLLSNFSWQFHIDDKIYSLFNKKFWRPWTYHDNKLAIIIHHTADYQDISKMNFQDEKQAMQKIYKFHTFTRWWWDIWYNFVIWPSWKIYEWKAGWPWIVWAHSKYNNTFTLWIALMGNFDVQQPTQAQIDSLIKLCAVLAYQYNINPFEKITFHRKSKDSLIDNHVYFALAWHKDTWWTSCPWKYLYAKLDYIRYEVNKLLHNKDFLNFQKKYSDNVKVGRKNARSEVFFLGDNWNSWKIECQNYCKIKINGKVLNTKLKKLYIKNTNKFIIWKILKYNIPLKSLWIIDWNDWKIYINSSNDIFKKILPWNVELEKVWTKILAYNY